MARTIAGVPYEDLTPRDAAAIDGAHEKIRDAYGASWGTNVERMSTLWARALLARLITTREYALAKREAGPSWHMTATGED